MSQQNIYDNSTFFEGYKKIREKKSNANDLFETPALFSLLPDLKGRKAMLKIKEAVIVEGRYDKLKLSNILDTLIIETNGFGIYKDKEKLKNAK